MCSALSFFHQVDYFALALPHHLTFQLVLMTTLHHMVQRKTSLARGFLCALGNPAMYEVLQQPHTGSQLFAKPSLHFIVVQSSVSLVHPLRKKIALLDRHLFYQHFGLEIRSSPWKCVYSQPATTGRCCAINRQVEAMHLFCSIHCQRRDIAPSPCLYFDIAPALLCIRDQRQRLKHRNSLKTIGLCSLILIDYIVFFLLNSFGRLSILSHPIEVRMGHWTRISWSFCQWEFGTFIPPHVLASSSLCNVSPI